MRETRDKEREREATEATKRERGYTERGATERERGASSMWNREVFFWFHFKRRLLDKSKLALTIRRLGKREREMLRHILQNFFVPN